MCQRDKRKMQNLFQKLLPASTLRADVVCSAFLLTAAMIHKHSVRGRAKTLLHNSAIYLAELSCLD